MEENGELKLIDTSCATGMISPFGSDTVQAHTLMDMRSVHARGCQGISPVHAGDNYES